MLKDWIDAGCSKHTITITQVSPCLNASFIIACYWFSEESSKTFKRLSVKDLKNAEKDPGGDDLPSQEEPDKKSDS